MRQGQLVSNSTQVTPNLLGLNYGPKPSKDVKTQTLMKEFPKEEAQIPELDVPFKKRRGRKPTIVARVDGEEQSQGADEETKHDKHSEEEEKHELTGGKDSGVIEMEEFCNAETEFIVNIITPVETDTPAGLRRSGRTRKPTPKILDSASKRSSHPPLGVKSPKKPDPPPQIEIVEENTEVPTTVSSPIKTRRKTKQDYVAPKKEDVRVEVAGSMAVGTEQSNEMPILETQTDVPEMEVAVTVEQEGEGVKPEQEDAAYVSLLQDPDAVAAVDELIETVDGKCFTETFLCF